MGNRRGHAAGKANLRFGKRSRHVVRGNPARRSIRLSRLRLSLSVRKTGGKNGAALGAEVLQELHAKDAAALHLLQAGPRARCNLLGRRATGDYSMPRMTEDGFVRFLQTAKTERTDLCGN